jgi:hypothetical protein
MKFHHQNNEVPRRFSPHLRRQVEVVCNKDGTEAVEIQKDTGTGWQFLAIKTLPNYTDTTSSLISAANCNRHASGSGFFSVKTLKFIGAG